MQAIFEISATHPADTTYAQLWTRKYCKKKTRAKIFLNLTF